LGVNMYETPAAGDDTRFPSFPDSEEAAPVTMEMVQAAMNEDTPPLKEPATGEGD